MKTEVPKAELAKDSKPAPVATAASVQGKKGEAKTSHTKVEPPTRQQEAVKRPACVLSTVDVFCGFSADSAVLQVQAPPTAAQANKEVKTAPEAIFVLRKHVSSCSGGAELCLRVQAPQDPLDALADILPSADSVGPRQPTFTGPEVTEVRLRVCGCV